MKTQTIVKRYVQRNRTDEIVPSELSLVQSEISELLESEVLQETEYCTTGGETIYKVDLQKLSR